MDNFFIRDPALVRLAAQSPAFAEHHKREAPAVRKAREEYQRQILSLRDVKAGLEKLRASGIKTERVLMCLAAFVQLERGATFTKRTKKIQSAPWRNSPETCGVALKKCKRPTALITFGRTYMPYRSGSRSHRRRRMTRERRLNECAKPLRTSK